MKVRDKNRRMKRIFLLLFVVLTTHSVICAQQKADYSSANKFYGRTINNLNLLGSTTVFPNFFKNDNRFWYSYYTKDGKMFYYVDPKAKKIEPLFNNQKMTEGLCQIFNVAYDPKSLPIPPMNMPMPGSTIETMTSAFVINERGDKFTFEHGGAILEYNRVTEKLTKIKDVERVAGKKTAPAPTGIISCDSTWIMYARAHNLYIKKLSDTTKVEKAITKNGEEYFSYAEKDEGAHKARVLPRGDWFKGTTTGFYILKEDRRKVGTIALLNNDADRPKADIIKFEMPGDKFVSQYTLEFYYPDKDQSRNVNISKWPDQKVEVVHNSSSQNAIYILRKRRTCDEIDICRIDCATGEVKVIINEVSKPYFNDQLHTLEFWDERKEILWLSERTGTAHYYLYDYEGKLKRQLTNGWWVAGKKLKVDMNSRSMFIEGYGREDGINPYYAMVYRIDLDGKKEIKLLTPEDANHKIIFCAKDNSFVDNYSRVDLEPAAVYRTSEGKKICDLSKADISKLYDMGWRKPERFTVKAADGMTDLHGVMWKPFNFDPQKKYPIISYVYPGPQAEGLSLDFTVNGVYNVSLSQVGFIVVTFGHRGGSPQRDKAYHTYGHGKLRDYPLADDKVGIEQLAQRYKFIDIDKVGIFGHSGGGFMATAAICTYPDFYKAAVAASANHDNGIYNRWWGETHHGVKQIGSDSSATFESKISTTMELASKLKGALMLVTGDFDNNVNPASTMRMANALIKANKNFDMLILPTQRHWYNGQGLTYFENRLWFFFAKHLLGDTSADFKSNIDDVLNNKR